MLTKNQPSSPAGPNGSPPRAGTKHAELSASLRGAIRNGQLKVGDRLPTEAQFVATTPYSLGTVQRAIRSLVQEGLVERKPKLGSFVIQSRRMISKPWHFRFLDSDRKTPLPVYPTVLSRAPVRQRGPWNDYLSGPLLRIDRLVNVNDEFLAFSRFFVDPGRFPVFEQVNLETLNGENFRSLMSSHMTISIDRICHRMFAGRAAPGLESHMRVLPDQTCTIIEIAASAGATDFVYFHELTVPPSNRRLELADPYSDDT
jgi:GntR family transcriptional regulator